MARFSTDYYEEYYLLGYNGVSPLRVNGRFGGRYPSKITV
jgi:hypothetical protein